MTTGLKVWACPLCGLTRPRFPDDVILGMEDPCIDCNARMELTSIEDIVAYTNPIRELLTPSTAKPCTIDDDELSVRLSLRLIG